MNTETLYSSYRAVEHYFRIVQNASGIKPAPNVALRGIDAFLMKQVASCYPVAPIVIDLAGGPTLGATTVFWASAHPVVQRVIAPRLSSERPTPIDWRGLAHGALEALGAGTDALTLADDVIDTPEAWAALKKSFNPASPLIFSAATVSPDPDEIARMLEWLLGLDRNPVIFVLPLGYVGESAALEAALSLCRAESPYRLSVPRDGRPFFAMSQLGILYRRENTHIPDILARVGHLFEGNFDFLALVESNNALRLQNRRLEFENSRRSINAPDSAGTPALPSPAVDAHPTPPTQTTPHESLSWRLRGTLGLRLAKAGLGSIGRAVLPAGHLAYCAEFLECSVPHRMQINTPYEGMVKVRNADTGPWLPASQTERCVNLSYHWLTEDGKMLVKEGMRTSLTSPVQVGDTIQATFQIIAPNRPGRFLLQPDLVHETVTWFSESGRPGPTFPVEIVAFG